MNFLKKLLEKDPRKRPRAKEALCHPFLAIEKLGKLAQEGPTEEGTQVETSVQFPSFSAQLPVQNRALIHNIDELFDSLTDLVDDANEAPLNSSIHNKPTQYAFVTKQSPFSGKNDSQVAQHQPGTHVEKTSRFATEDNQMSPILTYGCNPGTTTLIKYLKH